MPGGLQVDSVPVVAWLDSAGGFRKTFVFKWLVQIHMILSLVCSSALNKKNRLRLLWRCDEFEGLGFGLNFWTLLQDSHPGPFQSLSTAIGALPILINCNSSMQFSLRSLLGVHQCRSKKSSIHETNQANTSCLHGASGSNYWYQWHLLVFVVSKSLVYLKALDDS